MTDHSLSLDRHYPLPDIVLVTQQLNIPHSGPDLYTVTYSALRKDCPCNNHKPTIITSWDSEALVEVNNTSATVESYSRDSPRGTPSMEPADVLCTQTLLGYHGPGRTDRTRTPSLFRGTERTVLQLQLYSTVSRAGESEGLVCFRLSVLQQCAHEYEVSSEEFNDGNCLSCTYQDFTHLRS